MICPRITLISRKKISVIREISGQKKDFINRHYLAHDFNKAAISE